MNTIKKNISPLRKSGNNTLMNFQNENLEKNSKISKLIEETLLELNTKYNLITETINQLKQNLIQKILNIQELSIDDNNSTLKSDYFLKRNNNNKSPKCFNSISTRNFLKQNFINVSRNESRLKKGNIKSMNFREKNFHANNLFTNKNNRNNKLIKKNNKAIFRPIKPHLIYNSTNINKKENEKKSNSKIKKNVSFKSINDDKFNDRKLNSSFQNNLRLNSEDLNLEKSLIKENKVTEISDNSKDNRNINYTYNSFPTQENDKIINLKDKNIINKSESENENSSSESEEDNNSINDIENQKNEIFPSQTTQIGINFLTKEKEEEIYNENTEEAKKICELIYIILNAQNQFEGKNNVKDLFKYILDINNVNTIKELFFKVIYQKVYISDSVDKGIYKVFKKIVQQNLKELRLICKATNEPLSWLAMNILEINRYFQLTSNNK